MNRYEVDSWGQTQLHRLQNFFRQAKEGDSVVFDRKLAEDNARNGEPLDQNGCNSWVFHAVRCALLGLPDEKIALAASILITTEYLNPVSPDYERLPEPAEEREPGTEPEVGLADKEEERNPQTEAEEWARVVERFTQKPH